MGGWSPNSQAEQLCPQQAGPGSKIFHSNTQQTLTAPATQDEARQQLARLSNSDEAQRGAGAISLALGGNLPAFRRLFEQDAPELFIYALNYRNRDGTRCLDPEIEQALLGSLDDPQLSRRMHGFLTRNLYRSKALYRALLQTPLDPQKPRDYLPVSRSLTATNLPDIEGEVLDKAQGLPAPSTPVLKAVLPEVHQYLAAFFARRGYWPADAYLEALLTTYGLEKAGAYFKHGYANLRYAVYKALDALGAEIGAPVFIAQLGGLLRAPRNAYFVQELELVGAYAVKHGTGQTQQNQVARYLARFLNEPAPENESSGQAEPSQEFERRKISYQTHVKTIALLTDLGTPPAAAILVDELHWLAGRDNDPAAGTLIVKVLDAMVQMPPTVALDVPRLLAAAELLQPNQRLVLVPSVLARHPHTEGHAYLMAQMSSALAADRAFDLPMGYTASSLFEHLFQQVLAFDRPDYHHHTRAALERLFLDKALDEARYLALSGQLNDLLGDSSQTFEALLAQKKAERAQQKQRKQAEELAAYRKHWQEMVDQNLSESGIRQNIQALAGHGQNVRSAGKWLVMAGADILPYAHEVLRDPATDPRHAIRLLSVLAAVGDARSIPPILALAGQGENLSTLHKRIFLTLAALPAHQGAYELAAAQLEQDTSAAVQQSALIYLALQRDRRGAPWAQQFSASAEPGLQAAALFLAARLKDQQAKAAITALLQKGPTRSHRTLLLRALAELAAPEEFIVLTQKTKSDSQAQPYQTALHLAGFRHAEGDEQNAFAEKLLESELLQDQTEAVSHLIEARAIQRLRTHWPVNLPHELPLELQAMQSVVGQLIYVEARRSGCLLESGPEGIQLRCEDDQV